jgi:hypothetical protein
MPIARGDHEPGALGETVDRHNNCIAVRDGERAAGTEVVLDLDDDQRLHRSPI